MKINERIGDEKCVISFICVKCPHAKTLRYTLNAQFSQFRKNSIELKDKLSEYVCKEDNQC